MWSQRLFHLMCALGVIIIIMALMMQALTQKEQEWDDVSSLGLSSKMNSTLQQIYWQWQNEGRPGSILYSRGKPNSLLSSNSDKISTVKLYLSANGVLEIDKDIEGCKQLLELFIGDKYPISRLQIEVDILNDVELPETRRELNNLKINAISDDKVTSSTLNLCKFEYADRVYFYEIDSGELTIY